MSTKAGFNGSCFCGHEEFKKRNDRIDDDRTDVYWTCKKCGTILKWEHSKKTASFLFKQRQAEKALEPEQQNLFK